MPGWAIRTYGDLNQKHPQLYNSNCKKFLFGIHRLRRPLNTLKPSGIVLSSGTCGL
jgi:hypothetical protein